MRQSRGMSLVELLANVTIGFAVAVATQALVFPVFGIEATMGQHLAIGGLFTIVSIARSYLLRRLFERLRERKTPPGWAALVPVRSDQAMRQRRS